MINIDTLTEADKGRWVKYTHYFGRPSAGILHSWNDHILFVVYNCARKWSKYKNFTAMATSPEALSFIFPSAPVRSLVSRKHYIPRLRRSMKKPVRYEHS